MSAPPASVLLSPDAGPLITLAYAKSLDVLLKPGWSVALADMVLHEVTRSQTPTSQAIADWVNTNAIPVLKTQVFTRYQSALAAAGEMPRKANLGEYAIQEIMSELAFSALTLPNAEVVVQAVFLFEDHKIARTSFVLPSNCQKVSTRAYLLYLEQKGWLYSATEIERKAIQSGRVFSQIKFP